MGTFFFHGRIWQGNGRYASAMVVRRGRIAAIGDDTSLREMAEGCDFIDCGGKVMVPGFQDACLCLMAACSPVFSERYRGWQSIRSGCLRWLEHHPGAARRGFYACVSFDGCFPDKNALDEVLSGAPLVLEDICAGVSVLNTCALGCMEKKGISAECAQWMRKGADGRPDGMVRAFACREAAKIVPPMPVRELRPLLVKMLQTAAMQGITSLQSCDLGMTLPMKALPQLRRIYEERCDLPRMRCFRFPNENGSLPLHPHFPDHGGSPERGAVLAMQQSDHVHFQYTKAQMHSLIHRAGRQGMQLWVRAQGGKQLEEVLEGWEALPSGAENLQRTVILDGQNADLHLLEKAEENKLGLAVLPLHLTKSNADGLKALMQKEAHIGFAGLDVCLPFSGLQKAVLQMGGDAYAREQALSAYTRGSAWLQFREDFLGKLAPGYGADVQLLDKNYFTCPAEEIESIRPVLVMAAGKTLLRKI